MHAGTVLEVRDRSKVMQTEIGPRTRECWEDLSVPWIEVAMEEGGWALVDWNELDQVC